MCAPRRFIAALLILVGVMLSACDEPSVMFATPTPTPCDVDFRDLVPTGWVPIKTFVIETGGLGPKSQCAVLYRVDAQDNPNKIAPVEGVIYRRDHEMPPRPIHAYPLRLPGGYYLGEHDVYVRVGELISGAAKPQVVVEDLDMESNIVEASMFQWYDALEDQPLAPQDSSKMSYKLVGWFMGEGGVKVERDQVTVMDRIAVSRSRLAYQKIYVPNDKTKSYYLPGNGKLVDPEMNLIPLVECANPNAMCYPEKTVLDFYQDLNNDSALKGLMTPDAYDKFIQDNNLKFKYGCSSNRSQVDRALVQDITIQDAQSQVTVTKGQCKSKDGKFTPMARVVWTLERNNEGKWLLKKSQ
jgi:hypothetical protein